DYVEVSARAYEVPYSFKDRYYIRNISSDEKLGPELLVRIVESRQTDPLKEQASDNQKLTFESMMSLLSAHGSHPRNEPEFYESCGMMTSEGKFNMTAYLLSDQNDYAMQIIRFMGKGKECMSSREDLGHCCLLVAWKKILDRLSSFMNTRVELSEGPRKETNLFDMDALREAWTNACVHNRWRDSLPPSVFVYDDRIEIFSYGTRPFYLSEEEFFRGKSRPVNGALFDAFARMGYVEKSGHGIPTIVEAYGRDAFELTENDTTVTIPFLFEPDFVTVRKGIERNSLDLNEKERSVLKYLMDNNTAKLSEVSEDLGITLSSVKMTVSKLKEMGLLTNEGTNRNSRWVVI
ncbi:MAG: winged helix-turn-helix transcriptional regulator, partial [Candidatus Methanomethylophilaceae archaeon]|nr:winged helix-turn-helix transcriptional regulator [Candidatus Methanomethylophilaceae archaeon]